MKFNFALWFIADELVTCAIQTAIQLPIINNISYLMKIGGHFEFWPPLWKNKSFYQKHNNALRFWVNESVRYAMRTDMKLPINTE